MQLQKLTGLRGSDHGPVRAAQRPTARRRSTRSHGSPEQWACRSASGAHQLQDAMDAQQHALVINRSTMDVSSAAQPPLPLHGAYTCIRPTCSRPTTTAGVTPTKLAALSTALRMPVKQLQQLLADSPQLLKVPPEHLTLLQQAMQEELGLSAHAARQLLTRQPQMALSTPLPTLKAQAEELATLLGVASREVVRAAGRAPSMLARKPAAIAGQLQRMAEALGGQPMASMLRLAAAAPQFLTDSPASVSSRISSFSAALRRPPRLVVRALSGQPDMLFMSPRVMKNKLCVLQAILDRQFRLMVPIVLACPGLLRCDMDAVRAAYGVLRPISSRDADFTFGMVCHAPHLLLEHPQVLAGQARHVHHVARQVPCWHAQLGKLSPAQAADCLGQSAPTYARLNYLAATQQAESITLHAALTMPRSTFLARFPGASGIKEAVKQPMQLAPVPRWQGSQAQSQSQSARVASHEAAEGHQQAQLRSAHAQPAAMMQARLRAREEMGDEAMQGHGDMHHDAAWEVTEEVAMQGQRRAHVNGHVVEAEGAAGQRPGRRRRRQHFTDEDLLNWQPPHPQPQHPHQQHPEAQHLQQQQADVRQQQHDQQQQDAHVNLMLSDSHSWESLSHDPSSVAETFTALSQLGHASIPLQPWLTVPASDGMAHQGSNDPLTALQPSLQHLAPMADADLVSLPHDESLQGIGHVNGHVGINGHSGGMNEAEASSQSSGVLRQRWQMQGEEEQHWQHRQQHWEVQEGHDSGERQEQPMEPHTPGRPPAQEVAVGPLGALPNSGPQQQEQQQQQQEQQHSFASWADQHVLHVGEPELLGLLPRGCNGFGTAERVDMGRNGHTGNQMLLAPPMHHDTDSAYASTVQGDMDVHLVQSGVGMQAHNGTHHGAEDRDTDKGGRQRRARHRAGARQLHTGSSKELDSHQEAPTDQGETDLEVMRLGSPRSMPRRGALATRV